MDTASDAIWHAHALCHTTAASNARHKPAVQEQAPTCTVQGVYVIISSIASAANIAEDAVVIARIHHSWAQTLTD